MFRRRPRELRRRGRIMTDAMRLFAHPLTPLIALSVITAICRCLGICAGSDLRGGEIALQYGWIFMIVWWMDRDARWRNRLPCYDFGFFTLLCVPISPIWYCFWSRGWRGILLLLLLLFLWLAPYVIADTLWAVLASR